MKKYILIILTLIIGLSFACGECEHEYSSTVYEATCENDGYTLYKCNLCGDEYKSDIVRTPGHNTVKTKEGFAATCTESGLTDEFTCTICNKIVKQQEKISVLGHNFDKWIEITKPTKDSTGLLKRTCKTDNDHVEEYVLLELKKENYQYTLTPATCTKEGLEVFVIELDNQTFTYEAIVDIIPHKYVADVTEPTCLEIGYTTYTCSCGDSYVADYVDATGHKYVSVVTDPTCTTKGYTTHTCSCGDTYVDSETDIIPHTYVSVVTDPTCTTKGFTTHTCSCGDTYVDSETNIIPHTFTDEVTDPTCTTEGFTTHTCSCGFSYVDGTTEKLPHSYGETVVPPTCTTDGFTIYTCSCGDTYNDSIVVAFGHKYGEWSLVTTPTLTSTGELTRICANDNKHIDSITLPKLNKDDYAYTGKDATCLEAGSLVYKYTADTQIFEFPVDIPAKGHQHQTKVIEATCEEQGYTIYTCVCGDTYTGNFVDALGHSNAITKEYVAPTCTQSGLTEEITCQRCSLLVQSQTVIQALGHVNADTDYYCDQCGIPYCDDVIKISTYQQLMEIENKLNGFYQLTCDIDVTNKVWLGIGSESYPFTGYLYGNGYTITGLSNAGLVYHNLGIIDSVNLSNCRYAVTNVNSTFGIFSTLNSGTIKNCKLTGDNRIEANASYSFVGKEGNIGTIAFTNVLGGFSAKNEGEIINCISEGTFSTSFHTYTSHTHDMGFIGFYNDEYARCTHTYYCGIFAGQNNNLIKDCKVTGKNANSFSVTSTCTKSVGRAESIANAYVAAVCGSNTGTIKNVEVIQQVVMSKEVPTSQLKPSGATATTGTKNVLNQSFVSGHINVVSANTGKLENIQSKDN